MDKYSLTRGYFLEVLPVEECQGVFTRRAGVLGEVVDQGYSLQFLKEDIALVEEENERCPLEHWIPVQIRPNREGVGNPGNPIVLNHHLVVIRDGGHEEN